MAPNKNFLINPYYGGLGDHLFYSFLPRAIKNKWPSASVYLSNQVAFRSSEVYDLIWASNPFIDGMADPEDFIWEPRKSSGSKDQHEMRRLLIEYGLSKPGMREPVPELYCNINSSLAPVFDLVVDLNYSSYVGAVLQSDIIDIALENKQGVFVNPNPFLCKILPKSQIYITKSLFEYAALLMNSKRIICFGSGGATLAQALSKKATVYYGCGFSRIFMHEGNSHLQIGGNSFLRQLISFYLAQKNRNRRKSGIR